MAVGRAIALLLALCITAVGAAQLTAAERDGLASALFLRNLTLKDLDFARRESDIRPPLPAAEQALDHPLDGLDALLRLHASGAEGALADLLARAQAQLRIPLSDAPELPPSAVPETVPVPLRVPVGKLVAAIRAADDQIRAALSGLSSEERRTLIDSLPAMAAERRVPFDFAKTPPAPGADVRRLVAKVDLARLIGAASVLARRVETELPLLHAAAASQTVTASLNVPLALTVDDIPVELSGAGSQFHRGMAGGLCIALAGDNHFLGRYGAGVGAASVLIDFGDTAAYDVPDISAGAGLLGIGLDFELAGEARFQGRSLAFGAGVAGVGALLRDGGHDTFSATALAEGYGSRGVGLLVETRGHEDYRLKGWGQGAGADGGLGWLIDRSAENTYAAPGFGDLPYGDSANAQGYGRNGIGLLTSLGGHGTFRISSRGQGAGERLGVGSLYSGAGRNVYIAESSAQAFGADVGAGFLLDLAGNGEFIVRGGACQGTAQSRSVAVLFNRGGNNYYSSGDGRPGLATDGGLGLFLEAKGENRYMSPPSGSVPGRYGDGLGVFVDMGGDNSYAEGLENGQARVELDGAIAYDVGNAENIPPIEGFVPAPGSAPNPGGAQVDALIEEGTQAAANRLVAIGVPAYLRLMQRPLESLDSPLFNAVIRLGHALRQNAYSAVLAKLDSGDVKDQRRSLYLAASFGIGAAAPRVEKLIQAPETRREAAEAAGLLRVHAAVPVLITLAGSPDPSLALVAMLAIERIGDEAGIPVAKTLATSPSFPVRQSALRLLSHFSADGTATAQKLVQDPDERVRRIGVELYGRIGSDDALIQAGKFLSASSPGLKIQAMLAVDGHCPPALRPTLNALRFDANAEVRAVAARIDPGR
jgi:hypothetical protein